jgi:hypothetical protein
MSGLQTQSYMACSTCGPSLEDMAKYSSHLCKVVDLGHTKFLPLGHDMRSYPILFLSFDMPYEDECHLSKAITFAYWMDIANRVADPNDLMMFEGTGLTRWGILKSLPYSGELKICHLLDPMHIEGNVGKAIIK